MRLPDPRLCARCRGRGLCGLSYCPVISRAIALAKLGNIRLGRELFGSSPPSVFVGRVGYPYVNVGPSVPPERGDTRIYDFPEAWLDIDINRVIGYRMSLVTGSTKAKVYDAHNRLAQELQELALSSSPVDVELQLAKEPKPRIAFSEYEPPQGPRAPLERLRVAGNPKVPRPVEKAYQDGDLRAVEAVVMLYESGIPVTHIQKLLSVGALGLYKRRRLVPTRWSITAVDDIVSQHLISKVKRYEPLDSVEVYVRRTHDNLFIAVLLPQRWSYEWMEAWWPGSTWNAYGSEVVVEGDHEGYRGRWEYPDIGGCYFAARLATAEFLYRRRRQAAVILLREIYPGFNIPIGVWFVRENVRRMFLQPPALRTTDMREVVELLDRETRLGARRWLEASRILQRELAVRKLTDYLQAGGRKAGGVLR
ncbi:MAG: Nre family DNA repair protein [Thermoproteota archaeon]